MIGPFIPKEARSDNTFDEADWLLTCVASDGAITETPNGTVVLPYMGNYAAMGLARAYEITGNPKYIAAAWGWLAWYRDHMNATTGYVNDYSGSSGAWVDAGHTDSTDAYAGTYLVALWLAYNADVYGPSLIDAFIDSIPLAMTAIESTQQSDGLTYALPTYDVKYLEDNVETLAGVRAAELLAALPAVATALPTLAARASVTGEAMATGLGYMWNHDAACWDYAIHGGSGIARSYATNDWSDDNAQRQQAWATGWGALFSENFGRAILAAYAISVPNWTKKDTGYEPMPIWGYRNIQDHTTANAGALELQADAVKKGRAYPYTCQVSGILLLGLAAFSPSMPKPKVNFPDGVNLIPDPKFLVDTNLDGRPDVIVSTYGDPQFSLHPLLSGGSYLTANVPDGNGWAFSWDLIPVVENTYVTLSVWHRVTRLGAGGGGNLKYELYDSSNNLVTYGYNPRISAVGTDFVRWYQNMWIPPGVVSMKPVLELNSTSVDFAYPQVEVSGSPSAPPYGVPVPA